MKKALYPFQRTGAEFLKQNTHALLADEMGLGKTLTLLAACEALNFKRVAIVCPASVRLNWKQEIEENGLDLRRFNIDSYNAAVSQKFPAGHYDCGILDEAHFLKTVESQRTQAIFGNENGLIRNCTFKWPATGSPVLNRPREIYPIARTLFAHHIAPYDNWERFTQKYCGAYWDGRGMNTKGASNIADLSARMSKFMLRRTKAEVAPELPPRVISRPPMELSTEELAGVFAMEAEIGNREAYLSPTYENFSQLGDMAKMLHAVGMAKVRKIAEFVEDLLETEKKVVIFAWHKDVIKALENALGHCMPVLYHGGMNDEQKKGVVTEFVRDPSCEVFIGQLKAAGTGINGLQEVCNNVVFAELSWVPGEMAQAIDRCHRFGQKASCVNVYMPHVPGTLESAMLQVQIRKQTVIDALMGAPKEENLLEGLI